jgi:hypothetical protein
MSNKNKKRYVNKTDDKPKQKRTKTLSEEEQILLYADIISSFIINVILKADEERKHHSS